MGKEILRDSAIEEILGVLDRSVLTRHAFETSFNSQGGQIVRITFRDNPEFRFIIYEPDNPSPSWRVEEAPSKYLLSEESNSFSTFQHCVNRLNPWLKRVVEEITIQPPTSWADVARLRSIIDEYVEQLDKDDTPFQGDQADEWRGRIEEVFARVDELAEKNESLRSEVNELKRGLERLKNNLDTMPRRSWVRAVGGRLVDFAQKVMLKTDLNRSIAGVAIRALLPEAIIPDDVFPELPPGQED